MDESIRNDITHITVEENTTLTQTFTEQEVREAIFQMKHNKAPSPDGFPTEFYQVFWIPIKEDLIAMFADFHIGDLAILSLNFGVVSLLPNLQEAKQIQQYKPICMLNISLKIFTKVLAN